MLDLIEGFYSKFWMFLGIGLWIMVEAMILHDEPNGYDHICFIQVKGLPFLSLLREMFDLM